MMKVESENDEIPWEIQLLQFKQERTISSFCGVSDISYDLDEQRGEGHRSNVRWRLMIKIIPVFLLIAPEVSSERRVTLQPAILIFCKICRFLRRGVFSDEQRVIQSKFWCWYDGGLREVTGPALYHCSQDNCQNIHHPLPSLSPVSPQSLHYPRYHLI